MPDKKERRGEKKRSRHPPLAPAFLFPDFFSRGWKEEKRRVGQVAGMAEVNGKRDERESRGNSNYASLAAKATDVLCSAISVSPRAANIRRQPPKWTTG
ncbi:hypothetical protein ALC56_08030 [Trachymyrmex septentrionalis]|uniref:Uncharacterized protein n=1 Tax=Trachymyrmex septentrionalis TaxID=34720 RepID=A0A195FBR9_9HYME|nr:hypothetical protein ALC56_08030 [Trachymyrmex septentrionalis]